MCKDASETMILQCGREYGFGDKQNESLRATQLFKLSSDELTTLPTNNIPSEREFSIFDRKAIGAKCRNNRFKAKSIRNDMTLYKSSTFSNATSKNLKLKMKILNSNEEKWNKEQKQLSKNKIMEKLKKKENQSKYKKSIRPVQNMEWTSY